MICGVTGANGYLGSVIVQYFRRHGLTVYEFCRHSSPDNNSFQVKYSLNELPQAESLKKLDVLIHCAYDFRVHSWEQIRKVNVEGTRQLFSAAKSAGVKKIILISTISAFEGCKSYYGKAKLEAEKIARDFGAIIIKPGLVYGSKPGGMVGSLAKIILTFPIVPLVGSGKQILYLAHDEDVADAVLKASKFGCSIEKPIVAASEKPVQFKIMMTILAAQLNKRIILLPIPWQILFFGLKGLEIMGFKSKMRSDSLVSLMNQNPHLDFSTTQESGIRFRKFSEQGKS